MTRKVSKFGIFSWCLFDWANSVFPTIVMTFIFATYYTESVAKTTFIGTEQWGNAVAVSGILIAIFSPIFGAIADKRGKRKWWLAAFVTLMVTSTAMLWWAKPSHHYGLYMLVLVVMGIVGLEVGTVFYNAMLRHIAPKNYIGRISGWAWGMGYFGGLACLVAVLFLFINPDTAYFQLDHTTAEQVRICGPFAAVWILVFSLPLFIWTPDEPVFFIQESKRYIRDALSTLWQTIRTLPQHKAIMFFLIAHMLYVDGLNTLFAFGGIYAAGTFNFSMSQVLFFGIAMNISAGVGSVAFAWLDDLWGAKPTILFSLLGLLISGTAVLLVHSSLLFWILAVTLGLFVGPVQAASRSFMTRISPPKLINELFGLYAFSGRATAFLNPWLVGMLTLKTHSQRIGMSSVMLFILIGALLLLCVREKKHSTMSA